MGRVPRGARNRWIATAIAGLAGAACAGGLPAAGAATVSAAQHSGPATRLNPNGMYLLRGMDAANGVLFVEDFPDPTPAEPAPTHGLRMSADWGATFSANKGLPDGVTSVAKVLVFKSRIYLLGRNARTNRVGVYRATPTPGDAPLEWSAPLLTLNPSVSGLGTDFNSDSRFLYLGEYGDPKPGPRLYRSANGARWRVVFGPARGVRHVHGVAADPFHPGEVWMTAGDGVTAAYRSQRYGRRGSWRAVVASSAWQSVQISFDRSRVYLAADTHSRTFFVVDRKPLRARLGTPQYFASKHPPGSPPGTRYLFNAFFGAVDPSTGIYYCVANDNSEGQTGGGAWQGLFAVRHIGDPVSIVDPGGLAISMNGEVFVGGGRIWSGQWSVPALR